MPNVVYRCCNGLLWTLLLIGWRQAYAQNTSTPASPIGDSTQIIHLLNADELMGIQPKGKDSSQYQKLTGNVRLLQGGTIFSCDSALQNLTLNTMDAYGHIHINQADTINTYSDFLHYEGNTKIATLKKNVRMTDGHMVLTSNVLIYDMNTHIGSYLNGGKIVNQSTVLTSERGYYYADTKDVYFKSNVQLNDPEYTLATDTLLYNTNSRIATFVAPTSINTGTSIIHTTCGYYSTVENYAHLCDRAIIIDSAQQLTADSMNYNKNTGIGFAYGNGVWTDTAQKMTVLFNYAISDQQKNTLMATQKPLLIMERKTDTLFLAEDTLFSGLISRHHDTLPAAKPAENKKPGLFKELFKRKRDTGLQAPSVPAADNDSGVGKLSLPDSVKNRPSLRDTGMGRGPEGADSLIQKDSIPIAPVPADSMPPAVQPAPPPPDKDTGYPKIPEAPRPADSTMNSGDSLKIPQEKPAALPQSGGSPKTDSLSAGGDTTQLRYVLAYHHVRLFSDSLQGVSDSLYYSDVDSAFRFYKDPVLWTGNSQLTGDTIVLLTHDQQADRILLQQHAMIINQAEPGMYNQIKGTNIIGYFAQENVLDWMAVNGNAESLYYAQDDQGAFVGGNQSTSAKIHLYFKEGKLNKVVFLKDVDGTFTNPSHLTEEDKKLRGFKWEESQRPKSKTDLMK